MISFALWAKRPLSCSSSSSLATSTMVLVNVGVRGESRNTFLCLEQTPQL
jgi:hypothetical protein